MGFFDSSSTSNQTQNQTETNQTAQGSGLEVASRANLKNNTIVETDNGATMAALDNAKVAMDDMKDATGHLADQTAAMYGQSIDYAKDTTGQALTLAGQSDQQAKQAYEDYANAMQNTGATEAAQIADAYATANDKMDPAVLLKELAWPLALAFGVVAWTKRRRAA